MADMYRARQRMVADQIEARGIADPLLLAAMREVPREAFVAPALRCLAYQDGPLPIGDGQTISQPYIVALMIEAAALKPGDHLLEVGAGSGYAAAIASRIAAEVIAIERHPSLAEATRVKLLRLGYDNVEVLAGDGSGGVPDRAPFDAIIVSASGPAIPQALKEQLVIGGRLVMPVGSRRAERLVRLTRTSDKEYHQDDFGEVAFVPLIGRHAWKDIRGPE